MIGIVNRLAVGGDPKHFEVFGRDRLMTLETTLSGFGPPLPAAKVNRALAATNCSPLCVSPV